MCQVKNVQKWKGGAGFIPGINLRGILPQSNDTSFVLGFLIDSRLEKGGSLVPITVRQSKTKDKKHVDFLIGKSVIRFEGKALIKAVEENIVHD